MTAVHTPGKLSRVPNHKGYGEGYFAAAKELDEFWDNERSAGRA